jgi:hypothetical protein
LRRPHSLKDRRVQTSWLPYTLGVVVWIAAMAVTMRWLGRSRLRQRPCAQACQLTHPPGILLVGIVGTVFFVGCFVGALTWADASEPAWPYLIFAGLAVLSVYLVADYVNARHQIGDDGMQYGRALGQRGTFRWDEVERVGFNRRMNWYRITLRSGATVRISGTLMGLPEFARTVLRHVPAAQVDADTRTMLHDASNEQLHPLWK